MPETPNTETVQVVGIGAHQIVEGGCTPGRPGDHHLTAVLRSPVRIYAVR